MQHSSLVLFCEECGLANEPEASHCAACWRPLAHTSSALSVLPATPVAIAPPTVLEVTPGPLVMPLEQGASGLLAHFPACDFRPGSIFAGRYKIGEEIGRGGFSTVYRAVDREVDYLYREVAIKRIQLAHLSPRQIIDATETFNREVAMLARFRSVSGIPAYYAHLTDAENWYLITQYVEGETLEDYVQKAPGGYLAEKEVIELGIALAGLIQRLHNVEPPVIFRDVKPANIMLTPDRTFFLIDFGIARTFTPGKARDTTPLGSPGYAPPEQYGKAQTDQRSDIYSLGATLQTLLTGRDPLDLRSGQPSRSPQAPSFGLRKLLNDMLSTNPAGRPADMARVEKRLEYILQRRFTIFLSGLIFGGVLGISVLIASISTFTFFGFPVNNILIYFFTLPATVVSSFFSKRLHVPQKPPQGLRRFWVLGSLIGILFWWLLSLLFKYLF